jgi:hypothetical protein
MAGETQAFRNGAVLLSWFLGAPQQQTNARHMDRRCLYIPPSKCMYCTVLVV